jgi:hypothetical protein
MIQTINVSDFRDAFRACGRKDQFSYEGLGALFDYLEDFDGGGYELDVIALCCDYSEDSPEDIAEAYGIDLPEDQDEIERREIVRDYLDNHTTVVGETASGFIYCSSF